VLTCDNVWVYLPDGSFVHDPIIFLGYATVIVEDN